MKLLCSVAMLLVVAGCTPRAARFEAHPPLWTAITEARAAASAYDFDRADSLLTAAAVRHADEPQGAEALYWRALIQLDPRNRDGSRALAVQLLDEYLLRGDPPAHRVEAHTLRELAIVADSLQGEVATQPPVVEAATDTVQRPRERERELEREVARLREALERSNAELERIRRRLAAPPPR